ncbi:hypothetical protein GS421_00285 [Rhodococcus hoagii]|nr:hypothetical protein [Prescottella equi]
MVHGAGAGNPDRLRLVIRLVIEAGARIGVLDRIRITNLDRIGIPNPFGVLHRLGIGDLKGVTDRIETGSGE